MSGPSAQTLRDSREGHGVLNHLCTDSCVAIPLLKRPRFLTKQGKEYWMISAVPSTLGFTMEVCPFFLTANFPIISTKLATTQKERLSSAPEFYLHFDFSQSKPAFKIKGLALMFPSFDLPPLLHNVKMPYGFAFGGSHTHAHTHTHSSL